MVRSNYSVMSAIPNQRFLLCALALMFALAFGLAPAAHAATITVNSTAQEVPFVTNGNCTLGEAIVAANTDAAVDGCTAGAGADIIMLPAGTYTLTLVDNTGAFGPNGLPVISSDITILGAGSATTIIERSTAMGTPAFRIFEVISSPFTVVGVTIRNGDSANNDGGGLLHRGTTVTLTNCTFSNNTAGTAFGGAVGTVGAVTLVISGGTYSNNSSNFGGAIESSILTISNATVSNNTSSGQGGGLTVTSGPSTITGSTISGNMGGGNGGGIRNSGTLTIDNSSINTNVGGTVSGSGGGIHSTGSLTLTNTALFSNGTTTGDGGAIFTSSPATISGSLLAGNSAINGGGIQASGGTTTITNSTISNNSASTDGGGIRTAGTAIANLNNLTLTLNQADSDANGIGDGGGIFHTATTLNFRNTLLAGNLDSAGQAPDCVGTPNSLMSQGHNLVGNNNGCAIITGTGDLIGTNAAPIDPVLGNLQNNGGQTDTHALLIGSPAIDAGDPGVPGGGSPACESTDQRGTARPVGMFCDIGAFEGQVIPNTDLMIIKSDLPDPVIVGNNVTYTINVSNLGPDPATSVVVTDTLPMGTTFVSAITNQGSCSQAAGTVTCNLGTVPSSGGVVITIVVTAIAVGTLNNTVSISTTGNDPVAGNNSDPESTTVNPVDAELAVTKTDMPDPVNAGSNVTYSVAFTNLGPATATNVMLSDPLPANTTFQSATVPAGWMCTTPAVGAGGTITCTSASRASGAMDAFTFVIGTTAAAAPMISNTVTVSATEPDPVPANNSATAATTVNAANLSVTKTDAPDPVNAGSNLTYTVTVANAGPSAATSVVLTDTLPAGVTFVSATMPCTQAGGVVSCALGTINSGANVVITIVVTPTAGGMITNTASVSSAVTDPTPANNMVSQTTTVTQPLATDFTISASPTLINTAPGPTVMFTISLTGIGGAFNNPIALTCLAQPPLGSCTLTPASVTPGAGTGTATLSVSTQGNFGLAPPLVALWLAAASLALLALHRRGREPQRRRWQFAVSLVLLLVSLTLFQVACTQAERGVTGPYSVTVTGTFGTISHSTAVTVNLQ